MGYGGALIWTGLGRNLKKRYPEKKIIFIKGRCFNSDFVVYRNNNDMSLVSRFILPLIPKKDTIIVNMNNPDYLYCSKKNGKYIFKTGKHAIQIACDVHGIENAELKPRINLTEKEKQNAEDVLHNNEIKRSEKYICVEPNIKGILKTKEWFWQQWQELVDLLKLFLSDYVIVQVGIGGGRVLDGVINITGQTTFRETAYILKHSYILVSTMGGLVHLAKAMGKKSVVLVSGFEPLELSAYPDDINFYTDIDCKHCGIPENCPKNRKCMRGIKVKQVFDTIIERIGN